MRFCIALMFFWMSTGFALAQQSLVDTIKVIKPSVVGVGLHDPVGRPQDQLLGTGFVIGNGLTIVTNAHVIPKDLHDGKQQKHIAVFTGSGRQALVRPAQLMVKDEEHDLAILSIKGPPLPAMTLAPEPYVDEGTEIAFTGFPIGAVLGLYPVTHRGIIASITPTIIPLPHSDQISAKMLKRLRNPYLVYQLDATAYPGNSGSAMYDQQSGQVLGVINKVFVQQSKESVISNPSGITYAIPVKYVHQLLAKIPSNKG